MIDLIFNFLINSTDGVMQAFLFFSPAMYEMLFKKKGKKTSESEAASWFQSYGSHIGFFMGEASSEVIDRAKRFGYAASQVEHGSDIRYHTSQRNFTSWSPGYSEFSEGGFPVSHTITNPEVDFAYVTISIDNLRDTVDHGAGHGDIGAMTTAREHRVGFCVEIGINGLTDAEAQSAEFIQWLNYHGLQQTSSYPRKTITRNYFVQGLVNGGSYLIDVGRQEFNSAGFQDGFGEYNQASRPMASLEDGSDPGAVYDAEGLEGTTVDQSIPHDYDPGQDGGPGLGLNRFQQFTDNSLRSAFEQGMQTFFLPMRDANNSYNCWKMPPSIAGKTRFIKVTRTGRELISPIMQSQISFKSCTEIIDEKLAYPYSAVIQQSFNSRYFTSKPERSYHLRLKKILIPANYTPDNRNVPGSNVYSGNWDGTFKYEWSDNPAWVLYDLMTNNRYGIGAYLDINKIDKWTLYKIGRYCDAVDDSGNFVGVDNTYNGKEPRYTFNAIISREEEAYNLLKTISETFHGMAYWDGRGVSISLDGGGNAVSFTSFQSGTSYSVGHVVEFPHSTFNFYEKTASGGNNIKPGYDNNWQSYWKKVPGLQIDEPAINFTNTNVEGGTFAYYTSSKSTRYTVARVGYMDKKDNFRKKYEYVEDKQGVKELGIIKKNLEPLGCTSRGQARRMGRWFFLTSAMNTETITFTTDYRAVFLKPGNIISVSDSLKNTNQSIGKIIEIKNQDTLVLTHPISLKTQEAGNLSNREYFNIIIGNIDPSFDVNFLDQKGAVSAQDIEDLNKAQRIEGTVYPADGSSEITNEIKVKNSSGSFINFTTDIQDKYNNDSLEVVLKGADWALVAPSDGKAYVDAWKERKYRVQSIEESSQGKYVISAVHFDEEKLSSMDQTFPVITPEFDIEIGNASEAVNVGSPVIEKFTYKKTDPLSFDCKFYTNVDEKNLTNVTSTLQLISPLGVVTDYSYLVGAGAGAKKITIPTSVAKSSSAASGVWTVIVSTNAQVKSSGQNKSSASSSLATLIEDQQFSPSANPQVSNFGLYFDGQYTTSEAFVTQANQTFGLQWSYTDINLNSTVYTNYVELISQSTFFQGFKVGLTYLSGTTPQSSQIKWIHDNNNLLRNLSFNFKYDERYKLVTDSSNNFLFAFPALEDKRDIAVVVQAVAKAGGILRRSTYQYFKIYNQQSAYTSELTSTVGKFILDDTLFFDLDRDKSIHIFTTNDEGEQVEQEITNHQDIPDGARWNYVQELTDAGYTDLIDIYSPDQTTELYARIKDRTINAFRPNRLTSRSFSWGFGRKMNIFNLFKNRSSNYFAPISFDNIALIAEEYEENGSQYFPPAATDAVNTHFNNYIAIAAQKVDGVGDSEMAAQLGTWNPTSLVMNDSNKGVFQANLPEEAGANTLVGINSISIDVSGDAGSYFTKNVGKNILFVGESPDFTPTVDNILAENNSSSFEINFDDSAEEGINSDASYYFKIRVYDAHDWKNSLFEELDKLNEVPYQEINFGNTGYMIISEDDLQVGDEDEEEAEQIAQLGQNFLPMVGDQRLVGMKQFREGMIIGGTNTWEIDDGASSHPNSFVKYPLATHTNYQGSPVGIGQYNLESLVSKTYSDLNGEGDSSNSLSSTKGSLDSDMLDFYVNIKGMNLRCVEGDGGNYDGIGGMISGSVIKTAGFEAGQIVTFANEPMIGDSPMSSYFSEGEGVSGKIEDALNSTTIFDNKIQDTDFTKDLVISGDSRLKVEDGNLHIEVNGIWYKIIPDGTS
jgi:hypothetical protein